MQSVNKILCSCWLHKKALLYRLVLGTEQFAILPVLIHLMPELIGINVGQFAVKYTRAGPCKPLIWFLIFPCSPTSKSIWRPAANICMDLFSTLNDMWGVMQLQIKDLVLNCKMRKSTQENCPLLFLLFSSILFYSPSNLLHPRQHRPLWDWLYQRMIQGNYNTLVKSVWASYLPSRHVIVFQPSI